MKPKILVTRAIFPETIERLSQHFEVDYNDRDAALPVDQLAARLADKAGAITLLSDRIDAAALVGASGLKAVCNVAVGYNNFDLAAITQAGVMATNTPGCAQRHHGGHGLGPAADHRTPYRRRRPMGARRPVNRLEIPRRLVRQRRTSRHAGHPRHGSHRPGEPPCGRVRLRVIYHNRSHSPYLRSSRHATPRG